MDVEFKNQGNAAFQQGKFQESIDLFTQAIAINPSNHVYYSNRSGAYASLENYEKALEDAKKCVEINPQWAKGYVRKGLAEFYLKDLNAAKQTYEKGLEIEPDNQQLIEGLQRCEEESKPKGAQDQFMQQMMIKLMTNPKTAAYMQDPAFVQKLQMIQTNPQNAAMFMSDPKIQEAFQVMFSDMGFNMNDIKKQAQSQQEQQQDQKQSQNQDQPFKQSNFFEEEHESSEKQEQQQQKYQKQEQKQEQKQQKQEQKKEEKVSTFRDLGNQAYKKKDFHLAISHYQKAFEEDNQDVLALNNMAAVYIELGDFQQALDQCDKAIKVMDDNLIYDYLKRSKVYARKGSVLGKQKKYEESIQYYEKSLLESNDFKVKEELKQIQKLKKIYDEEQYINPEKAEEHNEIAKGFFKQGDWVNALKNYEEAIRRNPKDSKLYSNKGICLMKLMDFVNALSQFDKCLELEPNNVKAIAKKGNCYLMMKEYHKALSAFESGLKLDKTNVECSEGLQKTQMKIYGAGGESKEEQEQRAAHAMADPEIQAILRDPNIVSLLRGMQEDPKNKHNLEMMQDPVIASKINKLIAAGVIKIG